MRTVYHIVGGGAITARLMFAEENDIKSGALKIVLGIKNFIIYLLFVMAFSFAAGIIVNIII